MNTGITPHNIEAMFDTPNESINENETVCYNNNKGYWVYIKVDSFSDKDVVTVFCSQVLNGENRTLVINSISLYNMLELKWLLERCGILEQNRPNFLLI